MREYKPGAVFAVACMGMLVFGVVLTTLGAILPDVSARFGIDKAAAGSLFLLLTFGIMAGSILFGPLVDRAGYRVPLFVSLLLVEAGLQLIAHAPSFSAVRGGVLLIGISGGVINGGASALVADISDRKAAGLSLLGVFFGVGAVGVPFLLGTLSEIRPTMVLSAIGVGLLIPMLATLPVPFPPPKHAHAFPLAQAVALLRERPLLVFGFMLFLQSGMEITMGGWTATFAGEELGLGARGALYFLSTYWLGMMLARLAVGSLLSSMAPQRVLAGSLAVAFTGVLLLLGTDSVAVAVIGIFLVGAGFAAVFPVVLGWVGERYSALSGTAFSIALVMALAGGMLLPYVAGLLGGRVGLRASLLIVPMALLISAVTLALLASRHVLAPRVQPHAELS
jgi:FHS family glucose/mannose:H+ symporter-like MFS transporter